MSKITIQLNQIEYKSFKQSDFPITIEGRTKVGLEGDLIILTGKNGSGKSQFLDIIRKADYQVSHNQTQKVNSSTHFAEVEVEPSQIIYKSFKENPNGLKGGNTLQSNQSMAWNWFNNTNGSNPQNYQGYSKCCLELQKYFVKQNLTEIFSDFELFKKKLPNWFYIYPDDAFANTVYSLFHDYKNKEDQNFAITGGQNGVLNILPELKPWEELNLLFQDLSFDYKFEDPGFNLNARELDQNPLLVGSNNIKLDSSELSDGEKAILTLAISSISNRKNIKLLLLDEYDATFNPSLTEAFYKIIDKFFIQEGITVILTSHSPTTISLAPDNAEIYEIFKPSFKHRILRVNKTDYSEFKLASEIFYSRSDTESYKLKIENLELIDKLNHIKKPKIYFEGEIDVKYIKKALSFYKEYEYLNNEICIGYKNGSGQLDNFYKSLKETHDHIVHKIILYYDCDTNKNSENLGISIFKRIFIEQKSNFIKKGIENLFPNDSVKDFKCTKGYFLKSSTPNDDESNIKVWTLGNKECSESTQKRDLCNYICNRNNPDDFINFRPIFQTIEEIIKNK